MTKKTKGILIAAAVIVLLGVGFYGIIAEPTTYDGTFWYYISAGCFITLIVGWFYLYSYNKGSRNDES